MHVTIRADGSSEIGFGHLFRTSAVAEELHRQGHRVTYATTTPESVASVCPNTEIDELPSRTEAKPLIQSLSHDTDILLIDSYVVDEDYQQAVRDEVPVILISDDTRYPVCADLVINGNLYAPSLEYDFIGEEPTWCLGPEYLLLRQSIATQAANNPPWRRQPEQAIITMGGSDPTERTPEVIKAFNEFDLNVDAIIGPGFSGDQEREIRRTAEEVSANVYPIRDPDDLPRRMFEADFAVSTASTTTYELLALGTPIISVPVVDNQEPIATELQKRDLGIVLNQNSTQNNIRKAIRCYVEEADVRQANQHAGRNLIDLKGATRTCGKLLSLTNESIDS